jgi:hypothetical protein
MIAMRRIGLSVLLAASTFLWGVAAAGWPRGGIVRTPYGSANMRSPEWKQSGGDFRVYQQIVHQKQMMLQQKAMIKQQQAILRQQKKAESAPPSSPVATRPAPAAKTKKKRSTRKADPATVPAPKAKTPSKPSKP